MTAMVIFSIVLYSAVLAFYVFAAAVAYVHCRKGRLGDGRRLLTVSLVSLCGVLVSAVCIYDGRPLSGDYAVHLSFAMSPLFLHRLVGGWRQGLVIPIVVSVVVIASILISRLFDVPWDMTKWIPPLMVSVLLVLTGGIAWTYMGGRGHFDAVTAIKNWLASFADIAYYAALVLVASLGLCIGRADVWGVVASAFLCVVLLIGLLVALWLRLRFGRAFLLFWPREEAYIGNIIRRSMVENADNVECGLSGEKLFANLKDYFDKKMPYLNPDLTLTDVAKSLLTNKVYLSRAINDFTGKNFCQFVNFYRVRYAIRLFSGNNAYKVTDLAFKSGFHTERSFTMAFHLYMNISPSRWCKQNKDKSALKVLRN